MSLLDALLLDPFRINVWIAYRTDGVKGSGTQNDPYDGSSATKFDAIMNSLSANTTVHLGPATSTNPFSTTGFWTTSDGSTGSGWQPKAGMRIVGSGIDVTTLKLMGAADPSGSLKRHYFAIGHALSSSTIDYFDVSELTIDCNLAQSGTETRIACGAVRVMGNHARTRRIKVINWGKKASGPDCFVIAMITADPASGATAVIDTGIEDCIAIQPAAVTSSPITVFHAGPKDDSGSSVEGYGTGPFIRNCFCDCAALANPLTFDIRGFSMAWCKAGIVEGNQVHNTKYGGPYIGKSSSRDLVVRNNFYKNVAKGLFWDLGTKSGSTKTLSTLTFALISGVYEATATTSANHDLDVGDRVQILCNPSSLNGTFVVTAKISSTIFKYKTAVNGTFISGTAERVFGIAKLVVEGNTIELATGSSGLIGIHLNDNALASQAPDYAHGDVIIRDNKIRYVDGAFDASYTGYGIQINGAKNLLVRNNVVEAVQTPLLRNNRCGSVKYFNDKTPAGVLIQGVDEGNSNKRTTRLKSSGKHSQTFPARCIRCRGLILATTGVRP